MENPDLSRAILDDPDSDELRERYADWLAANGEEERSQLIRLQLQEARMPPSADPDETDPEWERLMAQVLALLKAHPEWRSFPELPGIQWGLGSPNFGFKGGFLDSVGVSGSEAFTTQMGRVFETAPVTTAVLEKVDDAGAAEIATSPYLSRLRHLSLAFCPVGDAAAEALASSPLATNLKSLRFYRCRVGARGAQALAASRYLSASLDLDLRGNPIDAASSTALRERFGKNVRVDSPGESARNPLRLDPFDEKLVNYMRALTTALSETAPDQTKGIECTVRNLAGAPDGIHTRVVHLQGARSSPAQIHPRVRQAANELARFWITEGGGFPGIRAKMARLPDGSWQVNVARLDVATA